MHRWIGPNVRARSPPTSQHSTTLAFPLYEFPFWADTGAFTHIPPRKSDFTTLSLSLRNPSQA